MRFLTWNMGKAGKARSRARRAWRYLRDELCPDIALLQEVRNEEALTDSGQCVWESASSQGWGTAVFVTQGTLTQVQGLGYNGVPGRCVAAEWRMESGAQILLVSIHAPTDPGVFPRLEQCLRAIEAQRGDMPLILAGDLNTARQAEARWPGHGHGEFWQSIDAGRLFDCHFRLNGAEKNTLVRGRKELRIQDDHILVSPCLAENITSVRVVAEAPFLRLDLSDHLPVVVNAT